MSVFQGTSLLSLGVSHQGTVSCPVPGFTQSCKSQEKLKTMLMQNFGWTTKSIMVFLRKAYKIRYCNTCICCVLKEDFKIHVVSALQFFS